MFHLFHGDGGGVGAAPSLHKPSRRGARCPSAVPPPAGWLLALAPAPNNPSPAPYNPSDVVFKGSLVSYHHHHSGPCEGQGVRALPGAAGDGWTGCRREGDAHKGALLSSSAGPCRQSCLRGVRNVRLRVRQRGFSSPFVSLLWRG